MYTAQETPGSIKISITSLKDDKRSCSVILSINDSHLNLKNYTKKIVNPTGL